MSKRNYRVRNWKKYNAALINRGKLTLWLDEESIEGWYENSTIKSGYHRRSLVENGFYRYKQLLGDKLASRQLANQHVEAMIKCHILNKLTLIGMPLSVAV